MLREWIGRISYKTFAEMTLEEKARYSHRGQAIKALLKAYEQGPPPREISQLE